MSKVKRAILTITFLLLLLASAGCGKVFFYSFEEEQSLNDGTYTWGIYGIGNYAFKTHGIVLDNKLVVCPLWFNGDVKVEVTFDLNVMASESISFGLLLSSEATDNPQGGHYCLLNAADSLHQALYFIETWGVNKEVRKKWLSLIPGLDKLGTNRIEIRKRGDKYKLSLNGSALFEYAANSYFADDFVVQIFGDIGDNTNDQALVIRDVKITF